MGRLLHMEFYKLVHDRVYWIILFITILVNLFVISGSRAFTLTGTKVLSFIMRKEILSFLIAGIYGGLSIGGDFVERTLFHGVVAGKSRARILTAKAVVSFLALDGILLLFPAIITLVCTLKNGWGAPESALIAGKIIALLLLGFSAGAVSLLSAVCFRDIGRTIGIPIVLAFVMILLLNSPNALFFAHILPMGTMPLVADGTVSPVFGMLAGAVWAAVPLGISLLIFRRAELR